ECWTCSSAFYTELGNSSISDEHVFFVALHFTTREQILFGLAGRSFDKMAKKYGVHYHFIFVESNGRQLQEVADIFNKLEIKPSIDTVYPFEEVNAALDKVANGRSRGKTVLSFN
ncbi:zinc-binding dehydrogenase, partial [Streptococcus suis]|uniref:zinc-binding dehydrogenase n=1 Tax=Streptococcus suis TaxID=1307 RepID=UPI001EF0F5D8